MTFVRSQSDTACDAHTHKKSSVIFMRNPFKKSVQSFPCFSSSLSYTPRGSPLCISYAGTRQPKIHEQTLTMVRWRHPCHRDQTYQLSFLQAQAPHHRLISRVREAFVDLLGALHPFFLPGLEAGQRTALLLGFPVDARVEAKATATQPGVFRTVRSPVRVLHICDVEIRQGRFRDMVPESDF